MSWKMVQSLKTKHCGHCTIVNSASASLGANKVDIKSGNVAIFITIRPLIFASGMILLDV